MAFPLMAPLMIGGLGASAYYNLKRGISSYEWNKRQSNAYKSLDMGYSRYLARHGLRVNPRRNITSGFKAKALSSDIAASNALYSAYGSLSGSIGAGAGMMSRWL